MNSSIVLAYGHCTGPMLPTLASLVNMPWTFESSMSINIYINCGYVFGSEIGLNHPSK
jgi:hypothetical protein